MKRLAFVVAVALAIVAGGAIHTANATVYTEAAIIDANELQITYPINPYLADGFLQFMVPVVSLQPGDEYVLILSFLPNQSITVTNCPPGPHCVSLLTFGDEVILPPNTNTPTTVSLIGATGDGFTSEVGGCDDCFYGGINPLLAPSVGSSLTFTGVEYIGEATSAFSTSGVESLGISIGGFTAGAMTVNEVPEPNSLCLFVTGLIGLWLLTRRRQITGCSIAI